MQQSVVRDQIGGDPFLLHELKHGHCLLESLLVAQCRDDDVVGDDSGGDVGERGLDLLDEGGDAGGAGVVGAGVGGEKGVEGEGGAGAF